MFIAMQDAEKKITQDKYTLKYWTSGLKQNIFSNTQNKHCYKIWEKWRCGNKQINK